MPLFSGARDISLFRTMNRELLHRIIETEVGYYKIDLEKTSNNIYGESQNKIYGDPILIQCYIDRGDPTATSPNGIADRARIFSFRFLRDDLIDINMYPEVGDIVMSNENYYEVDLVIDNQYFMGKNPEYVYTDDNENFGTSLSIIVNTHQIRPEIPGISRTQL